MAPPPQCHVSKGGASLARIVAIISTVPPLPDLPLDGRVVSDSELRPRLSIDLNLRLGPPPPLEGVGAPSASPPESALLDASAAGKSSEGECDPESETPPTNDEEDVDVLIVDDDEVSREARGGHGKESEERGGGSDGYLGLLLEAVRQVSGGLFDDDGGGGGGGGGHGEKEAEPSLAAAETETRSKRARPRLRRTWWEAAAALGFYEEEEEAAPLVRSKRGRSQALPSRFRDSILEPWAKPHPVLGARSTRQRTGR